MEANTKCGGNINTKYLTTLKSRYTHIISPLLTCKVSYCQVVFLPVIFSLYIFCFHHAFWRRKLAPRSLQTLITWWVYRWLPRVKDMCTVYIHMCHIKLVAATLWVKLFGSNLNSTGQTFNTIIVTFFELTPWVKIKH